MDAEGQNLDFTTGELIDLIKAKNSEIKKLKEEFAKAKKKKEDDEADKRVQELLERIKAK